MREKRKGLSRELFWKSERVCVVSMVAAAVLCCWSTWYMGAVVSRLWPLTPLLRTRLLSKEYVMSVVDERVASTPMEFQEDLEIWTKCRLRTRAHLCHLFLLIWRRALLGQTAKIIMGQHDSQRTLFYPLLLTHLHIQRELDLFRITLEASLSCYRAIPQISLFIFRFFFSVKMLFAYIECLSYYNSKINNSYNISGGISFSGSHTIRSSSNF